MWHATYTQGNQGNSQLLMVENQIVNLTFNLSFGHNLCFKYLNGSCKPILKIYVPRAFQWYKELFNLMGFDPYNYTLKVWESIKTPTPKMGAHLGVWGFIPYFSHTPKSMKCDSRASLLACTFANPCFHCEPKARVATIVLFCYHFLFFHCLLLLSFSSLPLSSFVIIFFFSIVFFCASFSSLPLSFLVFIYFSFPLLL